MRLPSANQTVEPDQKTLPLDDPHRSRELEAALPARPPPPQPAATRATAAATATATARALQDERVTLHLFFRRLVLGEAALHDRA